MLFSSFFADREDCLTFLMRSLMGNLAVIMCRLNLVTFWHLLGIASKSNHHFSGDLPQADMLDYLL